MSPVRIKEILKTEPFQPFTVVTGAGDAVDVLSREFAYLKPGNRTLQLSVPLVNNATQEDQFEEHQIDVFLITKVVSPVKRTRSRRRR